MGWATVVIVLAGCGRVGFDASASDGPGVDSKPCSAGRFGPFSAPVKLTGPIQSAGDDWFPTPSLGENAMFFHSFQGASVNGDLWFATRDDPSSEFAAPTRIVELATTAEEISPTLTEDGLEMLFIRSGIPDTMFRTTRADATSPWQPASAIIELDTSVANSAPWIAADGLAIAFVSDRTGPFTLFEARRLSRQAMFGAPVELSELHESGSQDRAVTLSRDGLEIFYSSSRTGGSGGLDIYTATRTAVDQPFGAPRQVPELSSVNDDFGARLSLDGRRIYFNYDAMTGGGTNGDIWQATRTCN